RKTSKKSCANAKWAGASNGLPGMAERSIDEIDGCLERGVYIQIRGVEQYRVFGHAKGRCGAALVALVAPPDIGEHLSFADRAAILDELEVTAPRALLGRGNDEQLHVGIGADDGADIATVEHGTPLSCSEVALIGEQRLAHLGMRGDDRRRLAD